MNEKLEKITNELEDYCKMHQKCDEALFNLGVQLGRELERCNISEFVPKLFLDKKSEAELFDKKRTQIKRIEENVMFFFKKAVQKTVEVEGNFEFTSSRYASQDNFIAEISEKCFVQLEKVNQIEDGGDFEISFVVIGELAEIFSKYDIDLTVVADLTNSSGDDSEIIYDKDDLDGFYYLRIMVDAHSDEWKLDDLVKAADEVEKFSLFKRIAI